MKSSLNAIYNATDIVTSGYLSTIKNAIFNTYKGFFEDKFNDLMIELINEDISEKEIIYFIENLNDIDKDIYYSILNKNIFVESKIKRFLLSKILLYKIKNIELDYFHLNLLSNIEILTEFDFSNLILIKKECNYINDGGIIVNSKKFDSPNYKITITKLKSIGIIEQDNYIFQEIDTKNSEDKVIFDKTIYFDKFLEYINEYYSK